MAKWGYPRNTKFKILNSINGIHHSNTLQKTYHIILSKDIEKESGKASFFYLLG